MRLLQKGLLLGIVLAGFGSQAHAQTFSRKPFLQKGSYNKASVCWRISAAAALTVKYGTDSTNLNLTSPASANATDGCATLDSATLQASTKYFYEVYNGATKITGSAKQFFITAPPKGGKKKSTFWVLGDPGSVGTPQTNVKNAFLKVNQGAAVDGILMLGDNAYESGTDAEFNSGLFNIYPDVMATAFTWSAVGNHEAVASTTAQPYLASFYLPSAGEAGGVPSGSELYYSFDYANIHFVILDSQVSSRSKTGAQYLWLQQDLQATQQDWIIAFWHHPPYSFSGHNSDTEQQMVDMRTNFLPLLEQYGVDITYTGHSHDYERSFLIDSAYGNSTDNNSKRSKVVLDGTSGNPTTTGAYRKASMKGPHLGSIHMVAGSSAKLDPVTGAHPMMYTQQSVYGSVILTIEDTVATSKFIDSAGVVRDQFQIVKSRGVVGISGRPGLKQGQGKFSQSGRRFSFSVNNTLPFRVYSTSGTLVSKETPRGTWTPSARILPAGAYYFRYGRQFGKILIP